MSLEPPEVPDKFNWPELRTSLLEWFFRFQRGQFLVPPGTVAAFATSSLPEGWVVTDGTDYVFDKFPNLYKVLGQNGAAPGFMRVPNIPADSYGTWMIKV